MYKFILALGLPLLLLSLGCTQNTSELKFNDKTARSVASSKLMDTDYAVEAQIGDRRVINSALLDVFQVSASDPDYSVFHQFLFDGDFGGACDLYESSEIPDSVNGGVMREFPERACGSEVTPVLPALSNPMRFALMTRRCEALIGGTTTLRISRLMARVFPDWTLAQAEQTIFAPSADSIKKAYRIFYRLDDPSDEVIQALLGVASHKSTQLGNWRSVMITLCMSPEWQQLGN
jgi:hypothetical protein